MHRKGGGQGEFKKYPGEGKLLNHRVAARKVNLAPENTSNCFDTGLKLEIEISLRKITPWPGVNGNPAVNLHIKNLGRKNHVEHILNR